MNKNKNNLDMNSNLKSKEIYCDDKCYSFNHIKPFYACDKQTLQTLKIIYLTQAQIKSIENNTSSKNKEDQKSSSLCV